MILTEQIHKTAMHTGQRVSESETDKRDRKRRERNIFLKVGTEFPQGESTGYGKMSSPGELSICCYQRIEMNRLNNRERKFWSSEGSV